MSVENLENENIQFPKELLDLPETMVWGKPIY